MRPFNAIAPYSVGQAGRGYAVFLRGQIIESGFDCRGDAVGHAHDLLDAEEEAEAAEAAMNALDAAADQQISTEQREAA